MATLAEAILSPAIAVSSLAKLSITGAANISKSYTAIEFLCQDFANTSIPLLNDGLGFAHHHQISQLEKFRLGRAFYRHQLMCNLFCLTEDEPLPDEERSQRFFHIFSPWVNEQLACAYAYLEAKVCEGEDQKILLILKTNA